jgi:signal transduction histidine kinase
VSDEGRGFTRGEDQELGIGLAGMEERAEHIGGQITIGSQPGHGTRVTLSIPLAASADAA